jgi:protein TonB
MTAIHYGLDPISPVRLYDQPEPRLKMTPRTLGAIMAVGLLYAGGGMMLNLVGIEFTIPNIVEPKAIQIEPWDPPAPERPLAPVLPAATPVMPVTEVTPTSPATNDPMVLPAIDEPLSPTAAAVSTTVDEPVVRPDPTPAPPPAPPMIRNPSWLTKPTAAQLDRLYPRRAAVRGISGAATLECRVNAQGGVSGCMVIRELPAGFGFGDAALASTRYFRLSPRTVDGQATEGAKVQIPMGFNLAE